MKKSNLKSLINHIIREAVVNKLGEGQPVGGVKNDHPFDAGRNNVMKAVNIAENERPCDCGSGMPSEWQYDGQGIELCRACPKCKQKKLSKYRPEILRGYSQADVDEPIEPEDDRYEESVVKEKVGFDGKYVDDMESGVAVKKLHNLDENCDINQQRAVAMLQDFARRLIYTLGIKDRSSYVTAEKVIKDFLPTFSEYFPENVNEQTGTGAVAGYATPFAFSKNKEGSGRAIASAKKYGKVVKSISEKKK